MNQALHIFRKDARRFWPQILVVAGLFAVYAVLSPETQLSGMSSLLEWGSLLSVLIVLACWTLSASVIHEDAPAQSSPFWLTRPFHRGSLLAAKVLFLVAFVFLPLLIAGAVLEARSGVSVMAQGGTLIALCIVRSGWLILPALVLGAVTRNLMEFASSVCTFILLLAIAEARMTGHWMDLLSPSQTWYATNIVALLPILLTAIGVVALQYAARRTRWNRGLLFGAAICSGLLMPNEGVARFSVRAMSTGFDADRVHLAFDEREPTRSEFDGRKPCWSVAIRDTGLHPGFVLRPLGSAAMLNAGELGDRKPQPATVEESEEGYRERVCNTVPFGAGSVMLRTSIEFAVISVSEIATVPAKRGVLDAGDAGRCEIVSTFPSSQLRCNIAEPLAGTITAGLEYAGFRTFSAGFGEREAMRLSPVLRKKFTGTTGRVHAGWPIDEAVDRGGARFVLRSERVIGYLRRDLVYQNVQFPWKRRLPVGKVTIK